MKLKQHLYDISTAAENLWRVLTTPRHVQADEQAAIEFCQKMRALGQVAEEPLRWAAFLTAAGATNDQVNIFAKVIAKRQIGNEDLHMLSETGIRIMLERGTRGSD